MSPDLLLKLVAIPVMLLVVHSVTASDTDQSLSQLAVSVQYEALRDVAGTTYEESFYSTKKSEEGLAANLNRDSNYATSVSYFDYVAGEDRAKEQLLARLADGSDSSILNMTLGGGIEGYTDVLVAGGTLIEEDGTFFENALWGDAGASGSYFSGLGDLSNKGGGATAACKPYAQIQKVQSQLTASEQSTAMGGSLAGDTKAKDKLIDPNVAKNFGKVSSSKGSPSSDLSVLELINVVDSVQQPLKAEMAIAETANLDQCFIAQAKIVFDLGQVAIAPIKQMPNLAYYNYFFSTTEAKVNLEDGSANFFLFRDTETSPEKAEKRKQLIQAARGEIKKWNAF